MDGSDVDEQGGHYRLRSQDIVQIRQDSRPWRQLIAACTAAEPITVILERTPGITPSGCASRSATRSVRASEGRPARFGDAAGSGIPPLEGVLEVWRAGIPLRSGAAGSLLTALDRQFVSVRPDGCSPGLDLWALKPGDAREAARIISTGFWVCRTSAGRVCITSPWRERWTILAWPHFRRITIWRLAPHEYPLGLRVDSRERV